MSSDSELPTEGEVVGDLKKIRRGDAQWWKPESIAELRALYDLLPPADRPSRTEDVKATRDALFGLLTQLVDGIEAEEAIDPPELDRSLALAARHLLRLEVLDGESPQVDDLIAEIVDSWKYSDKSTGELRPLQINTFRVNHMNDVHSVLALRLIADAKASDNVRSAANESAFGTHALLDGAAVDKSTHSDADRRLTEGTRRLRRISVAAASVIAAVCAVVVIVAGSLGHGPLADTPVHKSDCLSQLPATSTGGAGQIEFGDFVRASADGSFSDTVNASPGSEVAVKTRLSNTGPDRIDAVCVSAEVPETATASPSVSVNVASLPTAIPDDATDTASIKTDPAQATCLALVPGSTDVLDRNGAVVESLPDEVFDEGVQVGPIDVPLSSLRFVQFRVRLQTHEGGTACDGGAIASSD